MVKDFFKLALNVIFASDAITRIVASDSVNLHGPRENIDISINRDGASTNCAHFDLNLVKIIRDTRFLQGDASIAVTFW